MKLIETVGMMDNADYKERFRAEYLQLKIRMEGLDTMLAKYKAGTLTLKPTCSYDLLDGQLKAMYLYSTFLEDRAKIEDVSLEF
jgi:hypothetical protein